MSEYIYSRVSTEEQSVDAQLSGLRIKFPTAKVVSETASGVKARPILKALVGSLVEGDKLIVAALDRLGRRTLDVLQFIEELDKRGIILISVREGVDYSTITGRLVTQILVSVSEMERSLISQRTKAGLAAARAKGRIGGRPPLYSDRDIQDALAFLAAGMTAKKVARKTKISYSYLNYLRRRDKNSSRHLQGHRGHVKPALDS